MVRVLFAHNNGAYTELLGISPELIQYFIVFHLISVFILQRLLSAGTGEYHRSTSCPSLRV